MSVTSPNLEAIGIRVPPDSQIKPGYYVGLDVGSKTTAICVLDATGLICATIEVETQPEAISEALKPFRRRLRRIGHEAGYLSNWLSKSLLKLGLPVVSLEAGNARAALKAQRNKTDQTDAEGLAHLVRTGWYKDVHAKSDLSQKRRMLLKFRLMLMRKFHDIDKSIRSSLRDVGIDIGRSNRADFEAKVRNATAADEMLSAVTATMLDARRSIWNQFVRLESIVIEMVEADENCRLLLSVPGVGPVTALCYVSTIDDPSRFRRSRDVGAYLGLTPRRVQTGISKDYNLGISRAGDRQLRSLLWLSASSLLSNCKGDDRLQLWGRKLAASKGRRKACLAVARRMSVIMHAMLVSGRNYEGDGETSPGDTKRRLRSLRYQLLV